MLVEGPIDAIAVTLAGRGRYYGVAPLGTSLTDDQARQLGRPSAPTRSWPPTPTWPGRSPPTAPTGSSPPTASTPATPACPPAATPPTSSPAAGPAALAAALDAARPLADVLLEDRLTLPADQALPQALDVVAARPAPTWDTGLDQITHRLPVPPSEARRGLLDAARRWTRDPHQAARTPMNGIAAVRDRLTAAASRPPPERWAALAAALDPRLPGQGDWPALAAVLQHAHDHGHDITALTRRLVAEAPLDDLPAQDLRHRIVSRLGLAPAGDTRPAQSSPARRSTTGHPYPVHRGPPRHRSPRDEAGSRQPERCV